jgi:hypothetical protein
MAMAMPRASEARLSAGLFGATAVGSGMALPFQFATELRHLILQRLLSSITKTAGETPALQSCG